MHAHTLQEQQLLAGTLIVAEDGQGQRDEQEVVILLHDFSFKSSEEILAELTKGQHFRRQRDRLTGRRPRSGDPTWRSTCPNPGMA